MGCGLVRRLGGGLLVDLVCVVGFVAELRFRLFDCG